MIGITQPIVKHSIAIERADDVAQAVVDALRIATSGRPGPVLIDLPVDIANAPGPRRDPRAVPARLPAARAAERAPGPARGGGAGGRAAAGALRRRRRRQRRRGGGAARRSRRCPARPVTTTLMALGAFPASDPQWLGMLGMHGTKVANWAMDEADLIVAIGARFDDRVTGAIDEFARDAKIVHIDVDPSEIGKIVTAHVPVVGDAKLALRGAVRRLRRAATPTPTRLAEWWHRIRGWQAAHPLREPEPAEPGCVAPEFALDSLADVLGDAIVTTDVGQHQMWAAGRLRFEAPRRWITCGGLGTMGFGLPAALGAQAASPDATVVCVSGEGSFLMNVQELATAVEEQLPVKVLLLDNASLGHGPPAAGPVLGRPPHGGRPRREPRLGAARPRLRLVGALDRRRRRGRGRARRDARRARPRAAARPHRARGELPADVQAGRRGAGDDRLSNLSLLSGLWPPIGLARSRTRAT